MTIVDDDAGAGDGAFEQDSGPNGIVSMEAEHFDTEVARSSHDWNVVTTPSSASDSNAMEVEPSTGPMITSNIESTSPEMTYKVNFVKTGTHYIWVRGHALGSGGRDSVHFGFDTSYVNTIYFNHANEWTWYRGTLGNIASAGVQTVHLWMREPGFICDKVVLTVNDDYEPTGTGPAESSTGAAETYTLTVANGTGGGEYDENDTPNIVADVPETGSQFDQWTGDTSYVDNVIVTNTFVTMPNSDITVTATYEYYLTVTSGTGDGYYDPTTVVAISANAPAAWKVFDAWTGDTAYVDDVNASDANVTMPSAAVAVTATYDDLYQLTVTTGTGDGNYVESAVVNISADAPGAWEVFDQWTGDTQYIANVNATDTTVTMPNSAVTVTATYDDLYALTVSSGTGDGNYVENAVVAVSADEPNAGWGFANWTGDTSYLDYPNNADANVTMPNEAVTITASYSESEANDAFQQDSGPNGIVSMEAENYDDIESGTSGDDWNDVTSPSGYSGSGAMQALPDDGDMVTTSIETAAPELKFEVDFVKTGTHYLWVRGHDLGSGGKDSVHWGMDGSQDGTLYYDQNNQWTWKRGTLGNIASTGRYQINIFMREDGFICDKLVITSNSGYTPSGTGPAESSRG